VNLSDLAAAGAEPWCYQLAAALPLPADEAWFAQFCAGLAADQRTYGIVLSGGDTTGTEGPASFTVSALGLGDPARPLNRSGARRGDLVCVTGTIGDGLIGLQAVRGDLDIDAGARTALIERYRLPAPRVRTGLLLPGRASASVDVSDGLIADLGHICDASGVGAEIRAADVPLSETAHRLLGEGQLALATLLGGGDDYELVFTVPDEAVLSEIRDRAEVPVTVIGEILSGDNVTVRDAAGDVLEIATRGWTHF
jgi:thiamine-monophosphate kinase